MRPYHIKQIALHSAFLFFSTSSLAATCHILTGDGSKGISFRQELPISMIIPVLKATASQQRFTGGLESIRCVGDQGESITIIEGQNSKIDEKTPKFSEFTVRIFTDDGVSSEIVFALDATTAIVASQAAVLILNQVPYQQNGALKKVTTENKSSENLERFYVNFSTQDKSSTGVNIYAENSVQASNAIEIAGKYLLGGITIIKVEKNPAKM